MSEPAPKKPRKPRVPPVDLGKRIKRKSKTVSIECEPLVIDFDVSTMGIAQAMLADLKAQIQSQPGDKWDHSGKLLNGLFIDASGAEIFAPTDRLDRVETRERFRVEVMRPNPFDAPEVDKALGKMLGKMIPKVPKVKK